MHEAPKIDGTPLEEISHGGGDDLPPEFDVSIPLDAPDATERLEDIQEEAALSHTGHPMPENTESHEVTQEDEDELEASHLAHDVHRTLREQGAFDHNPSTWFKDIVLKNDIEELVQLKGAGHDEKTIERLMEKMAEEYPLKFKNINGGTQHSTDPRATEINLTKEEYLDRLHQIDLRKLIKEELAPKPSTETVKITPEEIELGEPIDDETVS